MIAINCRFLTQDLTGVQRFAEEITVELARSRSDIRLLAPRGHLRHHELGGVAVEQIGNASGHRWEQLDLPRTLLRDLGSPLLVSLMNTGPVGYRHQIVTHHDVTYVRFPRTYTYRFRTAYRLLSAVTLRRARSIITVSEFSRREIAEVYGIQPERITVVGNAAGAGFELPHKDSPEPYFLAVASLLPHKNVHRLVRVFENYHAQSASPTTLRLVGSSRPKTMSRAGGFPRAAHGVEFLGRVDDDELRVLYAGARGFIFPSIYEGFGLPPLEAQSAGTPVAAANIPPVREVLGDSARYFDPCDDSSMLAAIREIDCEVATRESLRAAGEQNVARYSWTDSARRVSSLLDRFSPQT